MQQRRNFTPEEDRLIRELWPSAPLSEVLVACSGRSYVVIRNRASDLRVRRLTLGDYHNGPMLNSLTEAERGYLAGLIDGDGSISFSRIVRKSRAVRPNATTLGKACYDYRVYVSINNTNKRMIDWCASKLPRGKAIIARRSGRQRLMMYGFVISTRPAITLLREIAPYLVCKREQAEELGKDYRHLSDSDREALYQWMRAFHTKGKQRCTILESPYSSRRHPLPQGAAQCERISEA